MISTPRPRFRGLTTYRDPGGLYEFRYPSDWNVFGLSGDQDGVLISPEAQNPQTWLTVCKVCLGEPIAAGDLDDLKLGMQDGLFNLTDCTIESASESVFGNLIRLERVHTFRQRQATWKRKLWVIYADKWQITLMWHGASIESFHYWFTLANYAFLTFKLSDALWFLTDPALNSKTAREIPFEQAEGGDMC